ncbi:MAG TPA: alpha/beta hydrolase [Candidatus Saccharimonadales bacterium]|nr:alpha/beta hydrolase [Candidatus Saccharimonadales bacterium]
MTSAVDGLAERFTTHEGKRLRYLTGGEGPPILLCHGFIGSAENFTDWFDVLLQRRTVIAPDLPGFGRSAPMDGGHTAPALARAALAAAQHAGADQFDVAGLCLGTPIALAVQRARPQATGRVILHTPLVAPWLVRRAFHIQVGFMLAPIVYPAIVWLAHQRPVSDIYKRLMVEGTNVDAVAAKANFDNQVLADPRAAREWLHDAMRRDDLAQVRGSGRPTLILVAEHDRIVNVRRLRSAIAGAPDVSFDVIRQAGHAWSPELSRRQRALIAAFLDDQPLPRTEGAAVAAA